MVSRAAQIVPKKLFCRYTSRAAQQPRKATALCTVPVPSRTRNTRRHDASPTTPAVCRPGRLRSVRGGCTRIRNAPSLPQSSTRDRSATDAYHARKGLVRGLRAAARTRARAQQLCRWRAGMWGGGECASHRRVLAAWRGRVRRWRHMKSAGTRGRSGVRCVRERVASSGDDGSASREVPRPASSSHRGAARGSPSRGGPTARSCSRSGPRRRRRRRRLRGAARGSLRARARGERGAQGREGGWRRQAGAPRDWWPGCPQL